MLMHTGSKCVFSSNKLLTTLACKLDDHVEYALEGSVFIGGAVIQWLRDGLGIIRSSPEVESLAKKVADNGGVYFVPAFVGATAQGLYFSELPGSNLAEVFEQKPECREALVRALGRALKRIHGWEPSLEKPKGDWLTEARARVRAGAEKHADALIAYPHSPFVGQTYAEVSAWVENTQTEAQLAFCHGDACLPNFLTDGGTITGVVDWGDAGWADPRFDLATMLWSLRRNGAEGYQESFLAGYGWDGGVASLRLFEAFYTLWS